MPQAGGGPPGGGPPKKGKAGLVIGLVGLAVVLLGGGALAWFFLLGASSVAHDHLPEGCKVVMRVDLEGLREVGPVEEHIMPALDEAVEESEDSGKITDFFLTAGLDPRKDLNDAAVCVTALEKEPEVVGIVGGKIKKNAILDAIEEHEDDMGFDIEGTEEEDGFRVIETDEEAFITQGGDGAFVVSNDEDLLLESAEGSSAYEEYELPLDKQFVIVVTKDAFEDAEDEMKGAPFAKGIGDAEGAVVTVDLDELKAEVTIKMGEDGDAEDFAETLEELKDSPLGSQAPKPVREAIEDAEVKADGSDVVITFELPEDEVEEACEEIAEEIEEAND